MWAPDSSAGNHGCTLVSHTPGVGPSSVPVANASGLTEGTEYWLDCWYTGTDTAYRQAAYTKVVLVRATSGDPKNTDVLAEVPATVQVSDSGTKRTWTAGFTMPKISTSKPFHVTLMGTYTGGPITGAVRGFGTKETFVKG